MKKKGISEAEVIGCYEVHGNSGIINLELSCKSMKKAKPGQFIFLEPLNKRSEIFRPLSVFDLEDGKITCLIKKVGSNTRAYAELMPGDIIIISEPRGKEFKIPKAKRYIFVAGGAGQAGIGYPAKAANKKNKEMLFLLGAKNERELIGQYFFRDYELVETITDKDGFVTDLLKKHLKNDNGKSVIIACGPIPMLKAVAKMAEEFGNKCFVSLEENMFCTGTGSCWGCVIPVKEGVPKRLCQDGPILDASMVDFDKIRDIHSFVPLKKVSRKTKKPMEIKLPARNGKKIILSSPILHASGCVGIENAEQSDNTYVGAFVVKGISLLPAYGNPTPRVCETPAGMINSIGLQNPGTDEFIAKYLPRWKALGKPVIVNIHGKTVKEFVEITKKLIDAGVTIIEINVSCPNVDEGGMLFGKSRVHTSNMVSAVRKVARSVYIIVKLTPNITDITEIAHAAASEGADAISLINTIQAMAIDVDTRRPKIAKVMGGLSGPAIKPIGVGMVHQVYQYLSKIEKFSEIPIVAMGGITNWRDSAEYIIAGASAVAIGTGNFSNDKVITENYDGLNKCRKDQGANNILDLKGSIVLD